MSEVAKNILSLMTCVNTSDKDLVRNLEACKALNLPTVQMGTALKERPLLICGSGPSLEYTIRMFDLKQCDIMALNGAYRTLLSWGIVPNYYVQLDARHVNVNFLDDIRPETSYILASQCHPAVFERLKYHAVHVFHMHVPTAHKVFPGQPLYVGGGGTVGLSAMAIAAVLGYRELHMLGYDSSVTDDRLHVIPQEQNANPELMDVWIDETKYMTTAAMAEQVNDILPWCNVLNRTFDGIQLNFVGRGLLYDYVSRARPIGEKTREEEAAKYTEAYKDPSYRMSDYRLDRITDILASRTGSDLLDVGTGRGETLKAAENLGYLCMGTETVRYLVDGIRVVYGLLPNLDFPDEQFEIVTSFEVLEHLLPVDVIPALRELARIARRRVIVSAATCSDVRGGVDLHPSHRSEVEWIETFKMAWGRNANITLIDNLSTKGVSPCFEYIK
jgi:ubiquinone/menaquinone biosynthesis C-methylase UbiE